MKKGMSWQKAQKYNALICQQNRLQDLLAQAQRKGDVYRVRMYNFHLRQTEKGIRKVIFSG